KGVAMCERKYNDPNEERLAEILWRVNALCQRVLKDHIQWNCALCFDVRGLHFASTTVGEHLEGALCAWMARERGGIACLGRRLARARARGDAEKVEVYDGLLNFSKRLLAELESNGEPAPDEPVVVRS